MVPLKYLSNFWRTLEITLISCEITLILTWSKNSFLVAGTARNKEPKSAINNTQFYASVVTLLTQDNVKLLNNQNHVLKEQLIGISIDLE